jgi:hypothetical protein
MKIKSKIFHLQGPENYMGSLMDHSRSVTKSWLDQKTPVYFKHLCSKYGICLPKSVANFPRSNGFGVLLVALGFVPSFCSPTETPEHCLHPVKEFKSKLSNLPVSLLLLEGVAPEREVGQAQKVRHNPVTVYQSTKCCCVPVETFNNNNLEH